ncbi:MAG: tetratricopeptide repeat protein [Acidobacteriota bacterium]
MRHTRTYIVPSFRAALYSGPLYACLLLLAGAVTLAGPTHAAPSPSADAPRPMADDLDPLAANDAMRAFVAEHIHPSLPDHLHLERLVAVQRDSTVDGLDYARGRTATAAETFATGQGNCLAFSNLYLVLARLAGIEVTMLRVHDVTRYRRADDDLVVVSGHVAIVHHFGRQRLIVDLAPDPGGSTERYHQVEPLTDDEARALYAINRGAEMLQDGEPSAALRHFQRALDWAPTMPDAWVASGVAKRRSGDAAGAERAYVRALELAPQLPTALGNLAVLLRAQQRVAEAEAVEAALGVSDQRNPYTWLALGDLHRIGGRLDEADDAYRRARRLLPDDPEPRAALGQLALAEGNRGRAARLLRQAERRAARAPAMVSSDLPASRLAHLSRALAGGG